MRKFSVRDLAFAAVIAALYFVMSYFSGIFGMTFGPVQIRFGEALTVLPFLFPASAPGLVVGCLITNLMSPYGPVDIIFGTLATAIAAWFTLRVPKWYLAGLPPILANMVILCPMWAWAEVGAVNDAFWASLDYNAVTFAVGEAVACYVLGTLLLAVLPRVPVLRTSLRQDAD